MKIDKYILKEKKSFEIELKKVFSNINRKNKLHNIMKYGVNNGGKRLRPIIIKEFSKSLGLAKTQYLPAMLAIELIHCYSLVHDDLPSMDDDDYRRGKLSTHKKYNEGQAILSGNSLLTLAFELISSLENKKLSILLAKLVGGSGLAGGQSMDLEFSRKKLKIQKILDIHELKTAYLFEFCASAPFIINNSKPRIISAARKYGNLFGRVFQIMDDIHDEAELDNHSINILSVCNKDEAILLCNKYSRQAEIHLKTIVSNKNCKMPEILASIMSN